MLNIYTAEQRVKKRQQTNEQKNLESKANSSHLGKPYIVVNF